MKKMSILALAAATLFGTLYADEETVKDNEPVATTESTEETSEGTNVSFNDEEEVKSSFLASKEDEETEVKTESFLAANTDEEEKPVEGERIA